MTSEKVVFAAPRHPVPMSLCLFTDGLRHLPFEEMLDACADMGIESLELGTGAYSVAPHLNLDELLESEDARKEYLDAIETVSYTHLSPVHFWIPMGLTRKMMYMWKFRTVSAASLIRRFQRALRKHVLIH